MVTLQKSTQELICQSLRNRIASGDLEPGTELKQVELARTYGVSRMPIREALQTLLLEGLVTRLSNRHMVVAEKARELLGNRKTGQAPVPEAQEPPASPVPVYRVAGDTPVKNVGKIHLLPAREQVASYLRKAILRREIPEGSVLTLEETASVIAAPFWSTIDRKPPQEQEKLRYLRKVFSSLLITGPFSIVLGFEGGLMALNDRLKLRSMVVGEKDDKVFIASEEAAMRAMEPNVENIYAPAGGEPVICLLYTSPSPRD
mgnify:CR=1 FL=1